MLYRLLTRHKNALVLDWEQSAQYLTGEQLSTRPLAGSHPHEVRKWLLAYSFFPTKWLNQIFSVGGISWEGHHLHLLAYRQKINGRQQGNDAIDGIDPGLKASILYEDNHCLIANKPAGLPVHQSYPGQVHTLDAQVDKYMEATHDEIVIRHIHRIDDDTSGPVLYAKHDLAQYLLDEAMREKRIDREYIAIVEGQLRQSKGTIDVPIGKDRHQPKRRVVTSTGDVAMTHYKLLESWPLHSVVELALVTGRTHQIRVHMSYIGHPLLGDKLYGGATKYLPYQALHGARLRFVHPFLDEVLTVDAPLPDWYAIIKQIISK